MNEPANRNETGRDDKGRFKPGHSGNPDGRPKNEVSITAIIKAHLEEHPEDIKNIVEMLIGKAKDGDKDHLKILLDRVDGKVVEKHEIKGNFDIRNIDPKLAKERVLAALARKNNKPN